MTPKTILTSLVIAAISLFLTASQQPHSTNYTTTSPLPVSHDSLRIAFWNLENLFDTTNTPASADNEFTPSGRERWNSKKFNAKVIKIREVITSIRPTVMGLAEVENAEVVKAILPDGYGYIHYDSPDIRGIDVALIYDTSKVRIRWSEPQRAYGERPTRDLLLCGIEIGGQKFMFCTVHLPSRRGNDPKAHYQRHLILNQIDSIAQTIYPTIVMGDFNTDPTHGLLPRFHNTTLPLHKKGQGSYAYRDVWHMYDQILTYKLLLSTSKIYTEGLIQREGRFKGYPAKSRPSDHLPVYLDLPVKFLKK